MIRFASAKIKEVIQPDQQGNIRTARKMVSSVDPNYLYAVVSGLHGDEANQNGDFFAWDELVKNHHQFAGKKVYATWVTKPNLVNHDSVRVVGEVLDAWPIEPEKSIDMLVKVARKNDWLVKPIERGEITDVSMGCSVAWSKCSECQHIAHDEAEWCEHLSPNRLALKGRTNPATGKFVYEDNRDVTGVELSWITFGEGADAKAGRKLILASKETSMLDDSEIDALVSAPVTKTGEAPGKPKVAIERKGSVQPFASVTGGGDPVVGGTTSGVAEQLLGGLVKGLITAVKVEANLGGVLTPESVMNAFENGDISKKDMVHLATRMGLGAGLEPKAAFEAIKNAVGAHTIEDVKNSLPTQGDVYVEVAAGGAELLVLAVLPGRAIVESNGQTTEMPIEALQDASKYRKLGRGRETDVMAAKKVVAQAITTPDKPESAATAQSDKKVKEEEAKKHVAVTTEEETKGDIDMSKATESADLVNSLKNLIAALTKTSAEQSLEDGLENAKPPVKSATPESVKSKAPNPEIKDEKALEKALDNGQDQAKDKVERQPEEEVIKTIDSGGKQVDLIIQDQLAQPDPNPGKATKDTNAPQETETLKTMKGADGLNSKTEMPKASALSIDLVEDAKSPAQSYWRVAVGKEPVFAVTAEKAFGNELTPAKLYQFKSMAYGNELRKAIRSNGIAKTLKDCFGGGKAAVTIAKASRIAQLDMGMLPKMPVPDEKEQTDLPNMPLDDMGEKPPMMGIDKDVAKDIEEGGKKGKSPFVDMLVDLVAPVIVKDDGKWTLEDVISELGKMAKGDPTLNIFQGKLEKKIEELKSKKGKGEDKKEDEHEAKEEPKEEKKEKAENPFAEKAEDKKEEKSDKELKLEAALKEITALLPAVAAKLQKSEVAEEEKHLKIRAVQTRKLAVRMAQLNMIETDGIDGYAAALAKKSDNEIAAVLDTVERAESALPRLEAARVAKVGEKIASLTGGAPIRNSLPGGNLDKTAAELSAVPTTQPLISWSRPPVVDESQKK